MTITGRTYLRPHQDGVMGEIPDPDLSGNKVEMIIKGFQRNPELSPPRINEEDQREVDKENVPEEEAAVENDQLEEPTVGDQSRGDGIQVQEETEDNQDEEEDNTGDKDTANSSKTKSWSSSQIKDNLSRL